MRVNVIVPLLYDNYEITQSCALIKAHISRFTWD